MNITLKGISKRFGDVLAVDSANLHVQSGEVLALLGENGAGKSTLMKILYGVFPATTGEIAIEGVVQKFRSPADARRAGIGMVFQAFNLIPNLTAAENLILSSEQTGFFVSRQSRAFADAEDALNKIGANIQSTTRAGDLAVGHQQLLELARVVQSKARLIILDEPTSVLTPMETEALYKQIRQLAAEGRAIVIITHKMDDVLACASRVCVLRRGQLVMEGRMADLTKAILVQHFVGEDVPCNPVAPPEKQITHLSVQKLSGTRDHDQISNVDFGMQHGEIIGIAGISGGGQHLLADLLVGLETPTEGDMLIDGLSVYSHDYDRNKISYIPEQPRVNAVAEDLNLATNLLLKQLRSLPWYRPTASKTEECERRLKEFDVRPANPEAKAKDLSGGNLQKLVLARELSAECHLVVACYPTMGLDLRAIQEVRRRLLEQARHGACVIWFSEDLDELLTYTHRVGVLSKGRLVGLTKTAETNRGYIGDWMISES